MTHLHAAEILGATPAQTGFGDPFRAIRHGAPDLDRRLQDLGLTRELLRRDLVVPAGAHLDLSTAADVASALAPRALETADLAVYKTWIGRADSGEHAAHDFGRAPAPWCRPTPSSLAELEAAELADLEAAGRIFLFGDSREVTSYRGVLEQLRGPFRAAVYAARRVVVEPGALLRISGDPAVVLFDELILRGGGRLVTSTPTHATFARLEKLKPTDPNSVH
ncbi:MAG: hypothetical protein AAFY88_10790 [Acidobacteriota bacterium]